jgi:hypothetical protein
VAGETVHRGQCHCGAITLRFVTRNAAADLPLRACQCGFCRKHGARTTSDPAGRAEIAIADPASVERYRFALGTAEYFVCRRCGVYVGAVMSEGDKAYAVLNVNAFADNAGFAAAGQGAAMNYDHENEAARRARRRAQWTPAVIR